jgi:hypothetical protein
MRNCKYIHLHYISKKLVPPIMVFNDAFKYLSDYIISIMIYGLSMILKKAAMVIKKVKLSL